MTLCEVMAELRACGVCLEVVGDRLKLTGPDDVVPMLAKKIGPFSDQIVQAMKAERAAAIVELCGRLDIDLSVTRDEIVVASNGRAWMGLIDEIREHADLIAEFLGGAA